MYTCWVLGHPYPLIFLSVGSDLPGGAKDDRIGAFMAKGRGNADDGRRNVVNE